MHQLWATLGTGMSPDNFSRFRHLWWDERGTSLSMWYALDVAMIFSHNHNTAHWIKEEGKEVLILTLTLGLPCFSAVCSAQLLMTSYIYGLKTDGRVGARERGLSQFTIWSWWTRPLCALVTQPNRKQRTFNYNHREPKQYDSNITSTMVPDWHNRSKEQECLTVSPKKTIE